MNLEDLILWSIFFWAQKAKLKWVKEGDVNSRLFHRMTNGKMKKKFIKILEVDHGVYVDREDRLVSEILNFYSSFYSDGGVEKLGIDGIDWMSIDEYRASWLLRPFGEI